MRRRSALREEKAKLRKLNRNSIPAPISLSGPSLSVKNETEDAEAYYADCIPWSAGHKAYSFKAYRSRNIKAALRQLAGGNCAYCESKIGGVGARQVEHYRPKGSVEGDPNHSGYWWLALDWDNLLPTCRDCNQSLRQHIVTEDMTREEVEELNSKDPTHSFGKASQFDIRGTRAVCATCNLDDEDPLLINPCQMDPASHLDWHLSSQLPVISPREQDDGPSVYGEYTIRTCALNRAELVLDRIPIRRQMRAIRTRVIDMLECWDGDAAILEHLIAEIENLQDFVHPEQTYTGMAAAFIDTFSHEIDQWLVEQGFAPFS